MKGDSILNCVKLQYALLFGIICVCLPILTANGQTVDQSAYNRLVHSGMDKLKAGDYQAARDHFEQATRYNDTAFDGHMGLGIACYHLRDDANAERELIRATQINPTVSLPYQILGELYYRKDDFTTAITNWEKAVKLNPADTGLRARLERIRKEHQTEKDFNREVTTHFLIKYEGREKIEAGKIVLRILEDAYSEVGRGLSYYPSQDISVILYSDAQFQDVTDAPGWTGALYDGKIRIPIGGIEQETPGLRRVLYHEYTHAVVHAITPRIPPTWLNEGLAQYFEGKEINARQKEFLRQLAQAGKLPPLSNLEGSFMGMDSNQAIFAYLLSLSAVRYMIDSYGLYRTKSVLEEIARGADTGRAISSGTMRSYEEFQRGWKQSLE